jgi:hypothetical protein
MIKQQEELASDKSDEILMDESTKKRISNKA